MGAAPLSVAVANTQRWPEVRPCLDALAPQIRALGGELIVADSDGHGVPDDAYPGVALRVLRMVGASPYQLRAAALAAASGEIVAVTEDHCVVRPHWCERVLDAHRRWPNAGVIGGAVENGARGRLIDWASFLVANGAYLLPIPEGPRESVSGQANVTYKRWALPGNGLPFGLVEAYHQRGLRERGVTLVSDGSLVVDHVQPLGLRGALAVNFHNGRCQAGFDALLMSPVARARRAARAVLAPLRIARDTGRIVLRTILRKRRFGKEAVLASPLIALVLGAHIAGEVAGFVGGPGDSPRHMR